MASEKRLLGRISRVKSEESNRRKLNMMLNDTEFGKRRTRDTITDASDIIGALEKCEEAHPHDEEDQAWKQFYTGVKFLDDMNGYKELNKYMVIEARRLEI